MDEGPDHIPNAAEVEKLYQRMGLPADSRLGKRVYKKLFAENATLGVTDKKAFSEDIDKVVWMFKLDPTTISIPAFTDDQREYLEVAILQVDCKTRKRTGRLAQIIHRAIPYPLLIVFSHESSVAFSLAHKRFSQSEKGAIVADDFFTSDWMDLTCPTDAQESFLDSLEVAKLPRTDLFAFYSAMVERVIALECSRLTGSFAVRERQPDGLSRREALAKCHQLETEIHRLRSEIKKEEQFNRRVELNVRIKDLERELGEATAQL